ncbi:putative repeat protein (TIGR03809 family) [Nitrobacteraceae bacterium AZCC 2161]
MIERWAALAERRLDYLTDLFESGRWRRFHTEAEFLENIQEAKVAVERWRAMATQEATADNMPVTWSWLDRPNGIPSCRGSVLHEEPRPRAMRPVVAVAEPVSLAASPTLQPAEAPPREATVTPADLEWKRALDPLIAGERYPMLRTTL